MNKPVHSQLEIFSETGNNAYTEQRSSGGFSEYVGKYEKIILIVIGFIVTGTVAFCLGIEKGKKAVYTAVAPAAAVPVQKISQPIQPPATKQPETIKPPKAAKELVFTPAPIANKRQSNTQLVRGFTIQLATFQTRSSAQRVADGLRRKGISPLVIPKGKYTILCVGNFSTKDTAASVLPEFKKKYHDCYIRRL
jgi:cell division protein FtsN